MDKSFTQGRAMFALEILESYEWEDGGSGRMALGEIRGYLESERRNHETINRIIEEAENASPYNARLKRWERFRREWEEQMAGVISPEALEKMRKDLSSPEFLNKILEFSKTPCHVDSADSTENVSVVGCGCRGGCPDGPEGKAGGLFTPEAKADLLRGRTAYGADCDKLAKQAAEADKKRAAALEKATGANPDKADQSGESEAETSVPAAGNHRSGTLPPADEKIPLDDPRAAAILRRAQHTVTTAKAASTEELQKLAELKKLVKQTRATTIEQVVELAKRSKLSQASLERALDISSGSISHVNADRVYPYIRQAFAQHFGIRNTEEVAQ